MRWSAAVVLGAAVSIAVAVAQTAPQAFLDGIYKAYVGKDAKGVRLEADADIRAYFATPLANAIIKDRAEAAKRGEAPKLDGDPFIDAQDFEIADLKIDVKTTGLAAAAGTVTFTNIGKPTTITLDLVRPAGNWRIADIKAPSGSLRALYGLK